MASSARIDELRKKFDENPRRYFAPLANEYRKAGDLDQAIFICQEYLPQQPGHMSGHIVYGQALYEMGRPEEAQVVFETALALDPENLIALRHLGDIAREANDYTAARSWYQRVLEADPRNEEIAQLMLSLLSEPAAQATSGATPASPATTAGHPTPLTTTPVQARDLGHETSIESAAHSSGLFVEKSEDAAARHGTPHSGAAVPEPDHAASFMPPADPGHAASLAQDEELLDLRDFNIGGTTPTNAGTHTPRWTTRAAEHSGEHLGEHADDREAEFEAGFPSAAAHEGFGRGEQFPSGSSNLSSEFGESGDSGEHSPPSREQEMSPADRLSHGDTAPESTSPSHIPTEHALAEEWSAGHVSAEHRSTEDASADDTSADHASTESALTQHASDHSSDEQPLSEHALSEHALSEHALSEHALSEHSPSEQMFDEHALEESGHIAPPQASAWMSSAEQPHARSHSETESAENGDLPVSFDDASPNGEPFASSAHESKDSHDSPGPTADTALGDDEFELVPPSEIFGSPSARANASSPDFGATTPNDPADDLVMFDAESEETFEADPRAIAGLPPMDTIEVGAGLELETPPHASHDFISFDGQDHGEREAHESEVHASDRIGPVDLAPAIEIVGGDSPSANSDAAMNADTASANSDDRSATFEAESGATHAAEGAWIDEPEVADDHEGQRHSHLDAGDAATTSSHTQPTTSSVEERFEALFEDVGAVGAEQSAPDTEAENTPAQPAEAFVTETMAELYLRQGHLDAAHGIYQRLVEQRPDDAALRERADAVEARVHGTPASSAAEAPPVAVYGGPTVREFLRGLAAMRPAAHTGASDVAYEGFDGAGSHDSTAVSDDFAADHAGVDQRAGNPSSGGLASFDAHEPASHDPSDSQARRDAAASADEAVANPLHGLPAHRATSELSLDHVFKGNTPPPATPDGFSLDRFFADDAVSGEARSATEGGVSSAGPDDIAQFNAWLNGLKKT